MELKLNFENFQSFRYDDISNLYQGILEEKQNKNMQVKSLLFSLEKSKYLENILFPILQEKNLKITKELIFSILIFINYKLSLRIRIFDYIAKISCDIFTKLFESVIEYDLFSLNNLERIIYI